MGFQSIPDGHVRLENVTVPGVLLGQDTDLVVTDLSLDAGKIVESGGAAVDMKRAILFPCFIDMLTHLD